MNNAFDSAHEKVAEVYTQLKDQAIRATSQTLKTLLVTEMTYCGEMIVAYGEYYQIYSDYIHTQLQNRIKLLQDAHAVSDSMKDDEMKRSYMQYASNASDLLGEFQSLDEWVLDFSQKTYLCLLERDFRNMDALWKEFGSAVTGILAEGAAYLVPIIAPLKFMHDSAQTFTELTSKIQNKGTEYTDVDIALTQLELRIELLAQAKDNYLECTRILKEHIQTNDI